MNSRNKIRGKRILSVVLALALGVSVLAGCGSKESSKGENVRTQTKKNIKKEIPATKYDLVASGSSDYYIMLPDAASENETFAASELQTFFKEATDYELPIRTESESKGEGSFLSVGDTEASKNQNITPTYDELGTSGFVLQTIEDDCYIKGFQDIGTRNGIYEFLSYCFDYECYSYDCITITDTSDLKLPAFELQVTPSFDYRMDTGSLIKNEEWTFRMKMNSTFEVFVDDLSCHNSFELIDPEVYDYTSAEYKDWFANTMFNNQQRKKMLPSQLCYSNEEMREEYLKNLKKKLANTDDPVMILGQEDGPEWCECEKCAAMKEKYDTNAAVLIQFANYIQEEILKWYAEEYPEKNPVRLIIFAYDPTRQPPVTYDKEKDTYVPIDDSVKLHDELGVYFATSSGAVNLLNSDEEATRRDQFKGWSAICNHVFNWQYSVYPLHIFMMWDSFEVMQQNYQFALEQNAIMMQDQTDNWQRKNSAAWYHAKYYVLSKLQWDVKLNMSELLDDFFANYFGEAGDVMQELFNEERQWYQHMYTDLGASGTLSEDPLKQEWWPYNMLVDALERIDEAYEKIAEYKESDPEQYKRLYDRITLESLQYRYIIISLYSSEYDAGELLNMKYSFRHDAERLEINNWREGSTLETLWSNWGIL